MTLDDYIRALIEWDGLPIMDGCGVESRHATYRLPDRASAHRSVTREDGGVNSGPTQSDSVQAGVAPGQPSTLNAAAQEANPNLVRDDATGPASAAPLIDGTCSAEGT